jgi:chitin disaccharide deacetylase
MPHRAELFHAAILAPTHQMRVLCNTKSERPIAMRESRPDSDEAHRLVLLALDRLIERRARMAKLFMLMHPPKELQFGDIDVLRRIANPKFLIITADDFGLDEAVNEAVEQGSVAGVLTAASLMVGAPAAADAVCRARRLPRLRVGLHLVLADGRAILPHDLLPGITDVDGHMDGEMFYRSVRLFALARIRRQVEAEIRAQFLAFVGTGLVLDHVNVHKHFHLHPTLLGIILRVGREFGISAIRVPDEPLWCASGPWAWRSRTSAILLKPWVALMKRRIRAAGIFHNDTVFGLSATGGVDEATLLTMLDSLPRGVSEIYLHPATKRDGPLTDSMREYRHAEELAGLLSPRVRATIMALNIGTGGFGDAAELLERFRA